MKVLSPCSLAFAGLALVACDNTVIVGTGGAGGSSGHGTSTASSVVSSSATGGPVGGPGEPPPPPGGPPADGSAPVAIAVTRFRIGLTEPNGVSSNDAWKSYGFDVDGQKTSTDFSNHCKPNSNASPKDVFPDGTDGRDNSFGKKLLPIFKSAAGSTDIEGQVNAAISSGKRTFIIDLPNLGADDTYDPLVAYALAGKNGSPGSWQLAPEELSGTTPDSSKMHLPVAYLTGGTFVATAGTIDIDLDLFASSGDGPPLRFSLGAATVAMNLSADHQSATDGVISGVMNTEEFITQLKKIVGAFSPDLCQGQAVESILNQVRQASDIMSDGTQDPTKTCDAISVGFGFDGAATALGGLAPAEPPPADPCAMP